MANNIIPDSREDMKELERDLVMQKGIQEWSVLVPHYLRSDPDSAPSNTWP